MSERTAIEKVFEKIEFGEEKGGVKWWRWTQEPEIKDLKKALHEIGVMQMELIALRLENARLRRIEQAAREYIENDDNMNVYRYNKLAAALEEK